MNIGIININDLGVQVAVNDQLICNSPGYAVIDDDRIFLGDEGRSRCKILPKWTNNHFWNEINANKLLQTNSFARNNADLVYLHIKQLWALIEKEVQALIIAVPGSFNEEKLGLLAGICEEHQIPLRSFVDSSVLEASFTETHENILHLELYLHSIALTKISKGRTTVRNDTKEISDYGFSKLVGNWANLISDQFIHNHRYDPFHNAQTEQDLFDKIPEWMSSFGEESIKTFGLKSSNGYQEVSVSREALIKNCASIYQQIIETINVTITSGEKTSLLLSSRLKGLPGFKSALELLKEIEIVDLSNLSAITSIFELKEELAKEGGGIKYFDRVVSLKKTKRSSLPSHSQTPSHLLWKHRAFPIHTNFNIDADSMNGPYQSEDPVARLSISESNLNLEIFKPDFIQVNGLPATEDCLLSTGDHLTIRAEQMVLISEINNG